MTTDRKPYTVRPIRGRYLVDGPGSDGIPLTTKAQAEAIVNLMNVAYEVALQRAADICDAAHDEMYAALEDVKDYRVLCEQIRDLRAALAWAQPAACSMLCPSTGTAGVPIPHKPECEAASAAISSLVRGRSVIEDVARSFTEKQWESIRPSCSEHGNQFTDEQWRAANGCPACVVESERSEDR